MERVKLGDHVVVKDEKNTMLHHLRSGKLEVKYYKSKLDLTNSIGNPYWSWYVLEPRAKNEYSIALCENKPVIRVDRKESGTDNRNIRQDQTSQLLSNEELCKMKEDGLPTNSIIQNLIDNSKSFGLKTQYSQEKYLSKKSKKYSNVIQILKPTIPLLANIFLKGPLYLSLRWDTLSQLTTSLDMRGDKVYIVYENHCQGIVGATLLNLLGKDGKIINIATPLNIKDKRKVFNAMQFDNETLERCVSVKYEDLVTLNRASKELEFKNQINDTELDDCNNLKGASKSKRMCPNHNLLTPTIESVEMNNFEPQTSNEVNQFKDARISTNLVITETKHHSCRLELLTGASNEESDRKDEAGNDAINTKNRVKNVLNDVTRCEINAMEMSDVVIIRGESNAAETSDSKTKRENNGKAATDVVTSAGNEIMEDSVGSNSAERKRKLSENFDTKSTQTENHGELRLLNVEKADGLVIVCKENPKVILKSLLKLVRPSRNFVVYSQYKEPLIELYGELRYSPSAIRLRLFDNFMRKYQVLPERTHPLNSMDGTGGYLLTGTVVEESTMKV